MRKKVKRKVLVILMSVLMMGFVTSPLFAAKQTVLTVWAGRANEVERGQAAVMKDYEKAHPEIKLKVEIASDVFSGLTEKSAAKLMIAMASGLAPDVVELNGPTIKGWAARGSLMLLDDFIKQSTIYDIRDYPPELVKEHSYEGKIYAVYSTISEGVTCWFFFWNKKIFRENGLDPNTPPANWDEIEVLAKKLTKLDNRGNLKVLGYHPMPTTDRTQNFINIAYGNGWESVSEDGKRVLLNDPSAVEALGWLVKVIDAQGGMDKIGRLEAGFKPGTQQPFLQDQIAMEDYGFWQVEDIGRYKPKMEFGIGFHPRKAGLPWKKITWNGGIWVWAMPTGCKHPKEAWEFMQATTTPEQVAKASRVQGDYIESIGGYWVPRSYLGSLRTQKMIAETYLPGFKEKASPDVYKAVSDYSFHVYDIADKIYGNFPTPLFGEYWSEVRRAVENAMYHKMTPKEALDASAQKLQKKLDEFHEEH